MNLDNVLYKFQKECVNFMVETGSCLNAGGVGVGKTLMSLSATERVGTKRNLVVVPKSLLLQWQSECNRWLPEYKTFVITGNKKQREEIYRKVAKCEDFFFMIIGYESLRIDKDVIENT